MKLVVKPKMPERTKLLKIDLREDWREPATMSEMLDSLVMQAEDQLTIGKYREDYSELKHLNVTADMIMCERDYDSFYEMAVNNYYFQIAVHKTDDEFAKEMASYESALAKYKSDKKDDNKRSREKELKELNRLKKKYEGKS